MTTRATLPLALLLTACAPSTNVEDAGSDASHFDAPDDAFRVEALDAFRPDSSEPDAFDPDAFVPPERCDGLDQDGDTRVDESAVDCSDDRVCVDADCVCYEGTYDCNPSRRCEYLDVTTREHCGGCAPCDAASDCSTEGPTPRCVPTRISDFTAAFEDSGITCIVRAADRRLACRSVNADGRVDSRIGWTDMGLDVWTAKAWGHVDAGGRAVTLCAHATDGFIYCRGSSASGLVPADGRTGWRQVQYLAAFVEPADWSIEGGEGIFPVGDGRDGLVIVGGPNAPGEAHVMDRFVIDLVPATRPFVIFEAEEFVRTGLGTWGAPVASLSSEPWTPRDDATIQLVETGPPGPVEKLACYHAYCCAQIRNGTERGVQCWGGPGSEVRYENIDLEGIAAPPLGDGNFHMQIFPSPTGPRLCIWNNCIDLRDIHEAPPSPRGHPLTFDSTMPVWGETRPDWRARCTRDDGRFACSGMHTGWPL